MTLDAVLVTDVGVVRDHNEDSAHIDAEHEFFIVADGMGGHAAGEVASAMAVETVQKTIESSRATIDAFAKNPSDAGRREIVQLLQSSVLAAHQAVFQRGNRESDKQGMGTTLDVVLIAGHEAFVAHVGDSRTYLIRDGRAAQITTDHTVAEVLVIEGKLSIEEAQVSPLRTILVNAIGVSADVGVEMAHLQLRRGDRILLCSDGLHDYFVAEQEIADKLSTADPGKALGEMVEMAKERGGHDNITGVVVNVVEVATETEAVPGMIELDQTQPVTVPPPAPGSWDDENTENVSPKDQAEMSRGAADAKAGEPGPAAKAASAGTAVVSDAATRETAPMTAMNVPGEPPAAALPPSERVTAPLKVVNKDEVAKLRAQAQKAAAEKDAAKEAAKDAPKEAGKEPDKKSRGRKKPVEKDAAAEADTVDDDATNDLAAPAGAGDKPAKPAKPDDSST